MQEHSFDALAASQVLLTEPSISRSSLCEILQVYLRGDETVCVGLHQHGEATVLHSILPEPVTQILTAYVRQEIPNALFTTIVVSKNVGLPVHRDTSNGKHPVHLLAISEFQGGGIWIEHPAGNCYKDFAGRRLTGQVLNFSEYKLSFQADQLLHCTQPWSGQRLVLAAFCVSRFANTAAMRQLVDLGFVPPLATGGLCPSAPVQPSRPLILELFAGTGRVSAALKIIGYEAVAVDHVKHPRAAHRIQIADLVTPEGVELVKSWLALPNCIGFFAAPPCGTCSRAREIAAQPGPPPLRSNEFPDGLPHLQGTCLAKVQAANKLYEVLSDLVLLGSQNNFVMVIENPRRSLYWRTSAFARIRHLLQFTAFQACAYGGRRPKWTSLAFTHTQFRVFAKTCPGPSCVANHLPWGPDPTATNGFATSTEASYPVPFCQQVARVFEQIHPVPALAPPPLSLAAARAETGSQPKASKLGPLVPEFKDIVQVLAPRNFTWPIAVRGRLSQPWTLPETCVSSLTTLPCHTQLLRAHSISGNNGEQSLSVWGIPFTVEEFVQQAVAAGHPRTIASSLPDVLQNAICKMPFSAGERAKVASSRATVFANWLKRAKDLEVDESNLKSAMPAEVRKILKPKRLLLWKSIMKEFGYPDQSVFEEVLHGSDLVGEVPPTGIFTEKFKPAESSVDALMARAPAARAAMIRSIRTQGEEIDKVVLEKTLEECSQGWASGPIPLDELPGHSIVSRRFGLVQGDKTRMIDDLSSSGINQTVQVFESPKPHTVDVAAAMIFRVMAVCAGHPVLGRSYDLKSAYRQLAISSASKWASYIGFWDHRSRRVGVYQLHALPFGGTRSVFSFLRVVHSLWWIGCVVLSLVWSCYFDDFLVVASRDDADGTHRVVTALLEVLGWKYASEGYKATGFSETLSALGVNILLAEIHLGRVYICNTERRVAELKNLILEASRGSLKKHQILKLQGRLQFAEGQLFGRAGRMMLHTLSNFIHNPAGCTTAEDCVEAMSQFLALLERGKPRTLDARSHHQWMLFTDASYDPGHTGWECGIGAMLFSGGGELVAAFSFPLDASMRAALGEQTKRTIIFEAEFLALVCAMKLWVRYLAWSPVVAFVDNNSARDVAISAKARSITAKGLVSEYLKAEYDFGVIPWVCRVPSPSNCADMPSRTHCEHIAWGKKMVRCENPKECIMDILDSVTAKKGT